MRSPLPFFEFVAKAALSCVGFTVTGDLAVEGLSCVAHDVWDWWGAGQPPTRLRGEVQAVAQLDDVGANQLAAQAVAEEPVTQTQQRREQLSAWLAQIPAAVRAAMRRPADPSGRTVPPSFPLNRAADLQPLLPLRLPRFRRADWPAALGGAWTFDELLGTGNFGETWKAVNPALPPWAVKVCLDGAARRGLQDQAVLLGRVLREATHPGIVRLMHVALSHDPALLAYEYVPGGELTTLVRETAAQPPDDLVPLAARVVHQLASIVAFAHRLTPPLIHLGLEPASILLSPSRGASEGLTLRVADYGLGGVTVERARRVSLYASPQQKNGERPDPRDDVHSLGVIWLHLLTGDLTLEPGYWRDALHGRDLPQPMLELLRACLAWKAEQRPANAGELAARLTAALAVSTKPPAHSLPTPSEPAKPTAGTSSVSRAVRTLLRGPTAHAEAKRLAAAYDYAGAVKALDDLPTPMRDPILYNTLVSQRDEVAVLQRRVSEACDAERFVGLAPTVERLLKLTPNDDLRQLLAALPTLPREVVNSIGMKFVLVPPGKFVMGSPTNERGRQEQEYPHEVEITRPFYACVFQTTQEQFQRIMGGNPSHFKGGSRPVEQVTWHEAFDFCTRLSQQSEEKSLGRLYRLPSEAEWEYLCRGGPASSSKPFHLAQPTGALSSTQANFAGEHSCNDAPKGPYRQHTTNVGSFDPNALGIFDLHGNVWEWCHDWHAADYYKQSPRQDPPGPKYGEYRVLRGGSWGNEAHHCRAAFRGWAPATSRHNLYGFRVVFCCG